MKTPSFNARLSAFPALFLAISMAAGILCHSAGLPWWIIAASALAGIAAICFKLHITSICCLGSLLGWLAATASSPAQAPAKIFDGNARIYHGCVTSSDSHADSKVALIRIDSIGNMQHSEAISPFLMQCFYNSGEKLPVGTIIKAKNIAPERPFTGLGLPYTPDYRPQIAYQGIVAQAFIPADSIIKTGFQNSAAAFMDRQRHRFLSILDSPNLSNEAYGLLSTLFTGDRSALLPDTATAFRGAGVAHALALSGFHLGFIAVFANFLLFPLRAWSRLRNLRHILLMILVWGFVFFTGANDSIVRSAVMLSVLFIGRVIGRDSFPFNNLAFAVVIILTFSPYSLYNVSFQLSVGAVAGILAFAQLLNPISNRRRLHYSIMQMVTVSLGAVAGTAVITAIYFHSIPLMFIPANLALAIALPLILISGLILCLFGSFGFYPALISKIPNEIVDFITKFASGLGDRDYSTITDIYLDQFAEIALIILTVIAIIAAALRSRRAIFALMLAIPAAVMFAYRSGDDIPPAEAYIVSDHSRSSIVMRSGNRIEALPLCDSAHTSAALAQLNSSLAGFIASRHVDSIHEARNRENFRPFRHHDRFISLGERIFAIPGPGNNVDSVALHVNTAVISRDYTGDIAQIIARLSPDTVIICRDVNLARASKMMHDASRAGIVAIDLRKASAPGIY